MGTSLAAVVNEDVTVATSFVTLTGQVENVTNVDFITIHLECTSGLSGNLDVELRDADNHPYYREIGDGSLAKRSYTVSGVGNGTKAALTFDVRGLDQVAFLGKHASTADFDVKISKQGSFGNTPTE